MMLRMKPIAHLEDEFLRPPGPRGPASPRSEDLSLHEDLGDNLDSIWDSSDEEADEDVWHDDLPPPPPRCVPSRTLDVAELLSAILSFLTLSPSSLLACACVSRDWHAAAIPLLYERVVARTPAELATLAHALAHLDPARYTDRPVTVRSLVFPRYTPPDDDGEFGAASIAALYPRTGLTGFRRHARSVEVSLCSSLSPSLFGELFSQSTTHLTSLRLPGNPRISDRDLALAAAACPQLRVLDVRACYAISDTGIAAVARGCPRLRVFDGGRHHSSAASGSDAALTDASLAALAAGCPALHTVSVAGSWVTDAGLRTLLAGCPRVARLSVAGCPGVTFRVVRWAGKRRMALLDVRECVRIAALARVVEDGGKAAAAVYAAWRRLVDAGGRVAMPVELMCAIQWHAVGGSPRRMSLVFPDVGGADMVAGSAVMSSIAASSAEVDDHPWNF
ncbi:hypothetical protein H9P43_009819 [Blastocladiella emersonii ATCC 22665]|nr:hypothetical protein H9P43_009819 [Blastocladiella emersonii ATCC 22665]